MSSIPGFSAELYEVCCERAIAEVRAGRPVVATASALVLGVEGLDNAVCARLDSIAGGQGRLILPAARLHQTDLGRRQAGAIALPVIDAARIRRLVLGINIRADEPVGQTLPLEEDALELMRRALVLPAALVLPVEADQIDPW